MTVTQVEVAAADSLTLNQVSEEENKQETAEENQNVEELKQKIVQTLKNSSEEEKKTEMLESGQIASIHKPVFRRYDVGNGVSFEFGF